MTKQEYRAIKHTLKYLYKTTKNNNFILSVNINMFTPDDLINEARIALQSFTNE